MKLPAMESQFSDTAKRRAFQTLLSIEEALQRLIDWNKNVNSPDDYAYSQAGMQLLTADAMLSSAIGEGINTINSKLPNFLNSNFPEIPWHEIVGMRNRIFHGYFDLNPESVFDVIKNDIVPLHNVIIKSISLIIK